jgi:hypothetical protein
MFKERLRFKLWGWLGVLSHSVAAWILEPFDDARSRIRDAKDIHLYSQIDALTYRAVALAYMGRCRQAHEDVREIHRLITVLHDDAGQGIGKRK